MSKKYYERLNEIFVKCDADNEDKETVKLIAGGFYKLWIKRKKTNFKKLVVFLISAFELFFDIVQQE